MSKQHLLAGQRLCVGTLSGAPGRLSRFYLLPCDRASPYQSIYLTRPPGSPEPPLGVTVDFDGKDVPGPVRIGVMGDPKRHVSCSYSVGAWYDSPVNLTRDEMVG